MEPRTFRSQPSKCSSKNTHSEKNSFIFPRESFFLYFWKWNPALFSLSSRNKKTHPEKVFYTSGNGNPEKNFLCSYVSRKGNPEKILFFFFYNDLQ